MIYGHSVDQLLDDKYRYFCSNGVLRTIEMNFLFLSSLGFILSLLLNLMNLKVIFGTILAGTY